MISTDNPISAQISWVYTRDLETACAFYAKILGFECLRDEGSARIFKTVGNAHIGVCLAFPGRAVEPEGNMISLVTDDVDGWYARLIAAGLSIDKAPHRLDQFGIYTFFIQDPNGYRIEFQQFDPVGATGAK